MSLRPSIPAVEGVQDKQVAGILGAMKAIIERATGRTPNNPQIKTLGANSTIGGVITKVNEVINRLQDVATVTATGGGASTPKDPSVAGAWVHFNGGTVAINGSFNVSSVDDNAVGNYTVRFTNPFISNANAFSVTPGDVGADVWGQGYSAMMSTSAVQVATLRGDRTLFDTTTVQVIVFGNR